MRRIIILVLAIGFFLLAQTAQAAGWTAIKRLTWTSGLSERPAVAVDSAGNLHLVWHDNTSGNAEIYYKKSTNGGATWSTNKRLTLTSGDSKNPAIAVDSSDRLHIFWGDYTPGNYEIYYRSSANGGVSWSAAKKLTSTAFDSYGPAITADSSGILHLVWSDDTPGNAEIYYGRSTDGGITWSKPRRLIWTTGDSLSPAIAFIALGNIHVFWQDGTPGNEEIYYKTSTDKGINWSANNRLTWTSGNSIQPAIAVDSSGCLYVVWSDTTPGNWEIYHRKSTNNGVNWSAIKRLTWTAGGSSHPSIGVDSSGRLHVVWWDTTFGGKGEIYYRKSMDKGTTWSTTNRLTWSSGISKDPSIAVDPSGNLHVFWQDNTPGNAEIYYKKQTSSVIITVPNAPTDLSATPLSGSTIKLTWVDNSNNEDKFEIESTTGGIIPYSKEGEVGANVTIYNSTGLTPSTPYHYRVRAWNTAGGSEYAYAIATTLPEPSTTQEFLATRDNVVAYNSLDSNVQTTVYQFTSLEVGCMFLYNAMYGYDVLAEASLLYFDVASTISGKTILQATLKLYPFMLPGDWNTVYRVYGLNRSWSGSTVTWDNCPGWYSYPYAEASLPVTTDIALEWDVTEIVQAWANGSRIYYGLIVWDPNTTPSYTPALRITSFESMDYYYDVDRRPLLEIEYK